MSLPIIGLHAVDIVDLSALDQPTVGLCRFISAVQLLQELNDLDERDERDERDEWVSVAVVVRL